MDVAFFDADGVLQRAMAGCFEALTRLADGRGDPMEEIFEAERPTLVGDADFVDELLVVLRRWSAANQLDTALQAWCEIEPDVDALQLVDELRESGVRCFVASNQNRYRADFMSKHLGYADRFDGELYSYSLGAAKPDATFFERAFRRTDAQPSTAILIDDSLTNTATAKALGMSTVHATPDEPGGNWIQLVRETCL